MAVISALQGCATPTAATQAKQLNINGPIGNSGDMIRDAILQAQELQQKLNLCIRLTDSADPNLATLQNVVASLN